MKNVFEMQDFTVTLEGGYGERLRVVSDVSLSIAEGKITGLIGESGSGKTVLWQTALGLRDPKHWSCAGGVWLAGRALDPGKPEAILRQRGESVSVILQDPMSAFDDLFTIEQHFWETARAHTNWSREETGYRAHALLERLYINDPAAVLASYPFQCSGGMLQRVMIAIALMFSSPLIIADEPTTSVDITVSREILAMLRELNKVNGTSILFISHDLKAVEHLADEICVMYGGYIVEQFPRGELSNGGAKHPYTRKLIAARPVFSKERLDVLRGNPPRLEERQSGCPFYSRCDFAEPACAAFDMRETLVSPAHSIRCRRSEEIN